MVVIFRDTRESVFGDDAKVSVDKAENKLYVEDENAVYEFDLSYIAKVDFKH